MSAVRAADLDIATNPKKRAERLLALEHDEAFRAGIARARDEVRQGKLTSVENVQDQLQLPRRP